MEGIDVSDFCKTQSEAYNFKVNLASLSEKIYESDFNLERVLLEELGIEKKDKFLSLLNNNKINIHSNSDMINFINKIKDQVVKLPVISLVLAFEPGDQTLKMISDWFILNIKKQVLLEITVDRSLIGGTAILVNGKYEDFSIKGIFEQIIKTEISAFNSVSKTKNNSAPGVK